MATLPPGVELPEGVTLPPGFADLPPGTTIPPGILDSLVNGTADGGDLPTDINDLFTGGGLGGGLGGGGGAALDDFNFANFANATPEFLPQRQVFYDKAPSTNAMGGIPRFGHPRDFSYVAYLLTDNGNPSDGEDYLVGLLFTGLFLLVFFSIWSAVLIIFKMCLNGFLSGEAFLNPWLDDPAEKKRKEEILEDGEEYIEDTNWKKQPFRIRITFFIAGLLQIIFAMLMVTKGVNNLQQTTDTVQLSTAELRLLIDEAVQTVDSLKQVGDTGYILRDQLVFDLDRDNFCPDNQPIFEQTQAGKDILASTDRAVTVLAQLGDFIGENVVTLDESMGDARRNLDQVDEAILEAEDNEWLGGLIAFPYLVLSSLMMVGAIAAQLHAMTDCFLCVLNWVVLPLFIFVTFVSFVMLSMMSIAASANADFCGGESSTPDQVLVDIMFRSGFDEDDLFYQMVRYYTNQCTAAAVTDPFLFLRGFDGSILQGRELVQNLTNTMDGESLDQLALACNRDFGLLKRSLEQMVGVMDALGQSTSRAINLLRCERVVPVYTDIVYGATCTYSISGFTWLFASLLIVSTMGMIMIMFRSSYQNTIFERPPPLDDSSGGSRRSRRSRKSRSSSGRSGSGSDQWSDER